MKQIDGEKMVADFKAGLKKKNDNSVEAQPIVEEKQEINIEDLLDDLSYTWNRMEVEEFHEHMREGRFAKAKQMLRLDLQENEAQAVLEYFRKKNESKMELVEIAIEDIPLVLSDQRYLFKYGDSLYTSRLQLFREEITFYAKDFIPVEKAQQAWVINSIEVAPKPKSKTKMK